jgi:DNA-binding LacI/PurR family transcriptional regulator
MAGVKPQEASEPSPGRAAPVRRKPSITDVARLAGVSYQTVSRVITGAPDVSAATRARILEVIEQVGYRRNKMATALVTNRSTVLGVITDGSPRYGPVATLLALENGAREAGYSCTVVTVREPYDQSVQQALDSLEDAGVDGVIFIAPLLVMATALRRARFHVPVEMIAAGASSSSRPTEVLTFSENQELGSRLATEHLIQLGHTQIAHVGGSTAWFDGLARKRGWEAALGASALPLGWYAEGDWSTTWAYQTGLQLVREGLPEAIVAASDHTALGLIRAFAENGIKVPRDVSVVGFDDIEGCDVFLPPLTTVRQDFPALAMGGLELLLGAIRGQVVDRTPMTPKLIVRSSTARPRRRLPKGVPAAV